MSFKERLEERLIQYLMENPEASGDDRRIRGFNEGAKAALECLLEYRAGKYSAPKGLEYIDWIPKDEVRRLASSLDNPARGGSREGGE